MPFARRALWRALTGFEPAANRYRPGGPPVEQIIMDTRHAVRRLIRRPRYALLCILTLALGIGGTAAVFGITRGVLLAPLPYTKAEDIALFWRPYQWRQHEFAFLRGNFPGFAEVAQYTGADQTLEIGSAPAQLVPGIAGSHELFSVLGARPAIGRTFNTSDDVKGAEAVAVISNSLWQELGGSPGILGTKIQLGGAATTVIGVMPKGFWFPTPDIKVWTPQQLNPTEENGNFVLIGRVAPGNHVDNIALPLSQLAATLAKNFPTTPQWDKSKDASVQSAREAFVGPLRPTLIAAFVAMGLILLIACANVAALMIGQVEERTTELAVRAALGATQRRIATQLLAEALILGLISGAVGGVIASLAFRWLSEALGLGVWNMNATLDWRVFAAAMTLATACALGISLAPTLSLWRGRLRGAIGASRTGGVHARGVRLESMMVVAEVALAVLVTAGAGLVTHSVNKLYAIDPGVETHGVGVIDVVLPNDLSMDGRAQTITGMLAGIQTVPGVKSAAVTQRLPLLGGAWRSFILVDGKPTLPSTSTNVRVVSADYLPTMGIKIVSGRGFNASDMLHTQLDSVGGVVIINETLAKKYFPGEDPIGKRVNTGFGRTMVQIVGVAREVKEGSLTDTATSTRYVPYPELGFVPTGESIVFKAEGAISPVSLVEPIRAAMQRATPRVAIRQTTTMDRVLAEAVGPARQLLTLVALLTGLALLLGAIGIYGVMSHMVARRRRDWGIRIALGLKPAQALAGVMTGSSQLVAIGVVIGTLSFMVLARFMSALLYNVQPIDPASIAAAAVALFAVGVGAALIPALRASRTDPAVVLREQ